MPTTTNCIDLTTPSLIVQNLGADGVVYADGSAKLQTTSAGSSGDVLTSNGAGMAPTFQAATTPATTCAFYAQNTTGETNVTGDGTIYTIIFNSELFDLGSNFDTTTGTFTAPATGKYQFNINLGISNLGAAHTLQVSRIVATAGDFFFSYSNPGTVGAGASNGVYIASGSVLVPMTSGDTATVTVGVFNSTKTVNIYGASAAQTCAFSGFRVV